MTNQSMNQQINKQQTTEAKNGLSNNTTLIEYILDGLVYHQNNQLKEVLCDLSNIRNDDVDYEQVNINIIKEVLGLLNENGNNEYNTVEILRAIETMQLDGTIDQFADSHTDIYNWSLYRSTPYIADWVEEAREEGLISQDSTLVQQLQIGQFRFYEQYANAVLELVAQYFTESADSE